MANWYLKYYCLFIDELPFNKINVVFFRDRLINWTYRLIPHSTSDFDDWLQFYKIDLKKSFLKK